MASTRPLSVRSHASPALSLENGVALGDLNVVYDGATYAFNRSSCLR
jgi:hypothetical protein